VSVEIDWRELLPAPLFFEISSRCFQS